MKSGLGVSLAALVALVPSLASAQDADVRIGLEIPASIVNVPMMIAADRLTAAGHTVEWVEFQSPETMTLALQNGEVDFIGTSVGTAFSAIDAGFEGRAFLGLAMSDFLMVATADLTTCEALDGKNVAVQSREGTTGVLTLRWLESACPDARPNVLIVPGSENRVAGLLAGQLDASPIDSQNTAQLMALRPGEFGTIDSFSEASVLASVYIASSAWLTEDAEIARAVAETYAEVVNEVYADDTEMLERTKALLADTDPAIVDAVVSGYLERGTFVPVSGVEASVIEDAIAFYGSARPYAVITGPADVADASFVEGLSDE
jgi:ABC-type nitrate/sulfonate/bicarbonate transport system substrate-binding protein